jgi:hypothetical protein
MIAQSGGHGRCPWLPLLDCTHPVDGLGPGERAIWGSRRYQRKIYGKRNHCGGLVNRDSDFRQ